MDPELVAYLDRRFAELIAVLDGRFDQIDGRFDQIDRRFAQIDGRFARMDGRLDQMDGRFAQMESGFAQVGDRFDELWRHFDVVAESLMDKIQLVAEGVAMVDGKLERFSAETRDEFRKVDRRLLHLTARVGRER